MAAERWRPAYIGIGSNLDDPCAQVTNACRAIAALADCCGFVVSPYYRSAPVGPQDQGDFVNAVAGVLTRLDAPTLLARLRDIETQHGRTRDGVRWGPRVIDLDLLMLSDVTLSTDQLTLPHARLAERRFVLEPWHALSPTLSVPGVGSLSALLAAVADQQVARIDGDAC